MESSQIGRTILCLVFVTLLSACVSNRPYRLQGLDRNAYERTYPGQKSLHEEVRVSSGQKFDLSFVEFDDKGDFWDRRQLGLTASRIRNSQKPVLLVIFIHGWHHNAADRKPGGKNPGDVETFRCLLAQLATSKSTSHLQIHGVYLGWRGRLIQGPLDYFTFLGRKATATRVAGTPVTETIFELIRQARKNSPDQAKAVVVGHSFGALVLEKAMAQAIAGTVLSHDAQSRGGSFNAPADLILLVNSAAESIYAKELSDMFDRIQHREHVNADRPLLISLTSETDTATGGWFPRGTFLPNLFARRQYRWDTKYNDFSAGVNQHDYLTTTPGHQKRLATHVVQWVGPGPKPERKATRPNPATFETCLVENPAFEENLRGLRFEKGRRMIFATSNPTVPTDFEWWRLEPLPGRQRPYWVMQVPKTIINDHSPIFTPEGRAMMAALFRLTNPKDAPGPRKMRLSQD